MTRALYRLTERLPRRSIYRTNPDGSQSPYLERYSVMRTRWLTIYLHRFVDRDQDSHMHDHPWNGYSLVLAGQYTERRLVADMVVRERAIRWVNFVHHDQFHMITEAAPETWTLFCHGKRAKARWGFLGEVVNGQAHITYAPESDPAWHKRASAVEREPMKHVI